MKLGFSNVPCSDAPSGCRVEKGGGIRAAKTGGRREVGERVGRVADGASGTLRGGERRADGEMRLVKLGSRLLLATKSSSISSSFSWVQSRRVLT